LREITHFFSIYKDLEGKRVETKGWHDASVARRLIIESQKAFEREQSRELAEKGIVEQVSK
jgi:inorganic pyrophosphatase